MPSTNPWVPESFTLPEVLEHWRRHTQQALLAEPDYWKLPVVDPADEVALHGKRTDPSFIVTLIDTLTEMVWQVENWNDLPGLQAKGYGWIVAVVEAAGFEQVTP